LIVRTIPRGGTEITELVAKRLDVTVPDAEALKCRIGLRSGDDPEATDAITEALRPLVNEIRSSFVYLTTGDQQRRVTRLVLSGGGALLPGLDDALRAQFGVEVGIVDPTIRLRSQRTGRTDGADDGLERVRSSATVSVGLALGVAA
jgi:type IV pilus assembly protein PilM